MIHDLIETNAATISASKGKIKSRKMKLVNRISARAKFRFLPILVIVLLVFTLATSMSNLARTRAAPTPTPGTHLTVEQTFGGTSNPPPGTYTYDAGSIAPVTGVPDVGYELIDWYLDGVSQLPWWPKGTNPLYITMNIDHTILPVFGQIVVPPKVISPVSASASSGGRYANLGPSKAIDGVESTSSYWDSTNPDGTGACPQYLTVDYGTQVQFGSVRIHFWDGDSRSYQYYLKVSSDGNQWTSVTSSRTVAGVAVDNLASPVAGRYLRVQVLSQVAGLNNYAHIEEVIAYAAVQTVGVISPVSASASSGGRYANLGPSKAIDGVESTSSYWDSTNPDGTGACPQYLTVDYGTQVQFGSVRIHFWDGDSRSYQYYLKVSSDGNQWTSVTSSRTVAGVAVDNLASPVAGRYLRVQVLSQVAGLNNYAHIEEVIAYASESAPINPPSPSERLMGLCATEWQHFTLELAALIKSSGGQVLRYQMYSNDWVNNIQSWMYPGTYYRAKMMQIKQWFSDYGIKFWLDAVGYYWNPSEGWGNMQARVIFNTNGAGDAWIATWSQIISALQPDIVGVMNEPGRISDASEYSGVTQAQYYTAYRQFVIRSINAYKAIKPDLVIAACSMPFYDFTAVAVNPIPGVDFYEFHDYYALDNKYPPAYQLGQRAYWDGNLAQAKTLQYELWLHSGSHLQAMFDAGLSVVMSEFGASNLNPNYLIFMQDCYDFAKTYNIGILQCPFEAWDPLKGYYAGGILETDNPGKVYDTWTRLNALGQLWARNMQS